LTKQALIDNDNDDVFQFQLGPSSRRRATTSKTNKAKRKKSLPTFLGHALSGSLQWFILMPT